MTFALALDTVIQTAVVAGAKMLSKRRGVSRSRVFSRVASLLIAITGLYAVRAFAAIPDAERQTLIAIFEATNGAGWGLEANWCTTARCAATEPEFSPPGTECALGDGVTGWYGVECDDAHEHVVDLNLSANHLAGTLPSLAALTHLELLSLESNALSGPLPDLSALTALRRFSATNNRFTGSIPDLRDATSLQFYHVGDNLLTGSIPDLDGLVALQGFDARDNFLTGPIPALQGLPVLTSFLVSRNALTGAIPDLSGLDALRSFFASDNRLSGAIPQLATLSSLRQFIVSRNFLTGAIPTLPEGLLQIDVGNNLLTGPVPAAPSTLWSSLSTLCPNPLDLTPSENDAAWDIATFRTPWWADHAPNSRCDGLFESGFDTL